MSTPEQKGKITSWASNDGSFKRQTSSFRDVIEQGGRFEPEKGRYHLYVSLACPWAHRTLIVRKLKGLEEYLDVSVVHPHMDDLGWRFNGTANETFPAATADNLYGLSRIRDLYHKASPEYNARFTVPVVWDTKEQTIVSNESSEIIRFFNTAFNASLPSETRDLDFYPSDLRKEIDEINDWIYSDINNGVYKAGFATTQQAYEGAVKPLGEAMQRVEELLGDGREFLVGGKLTEADIRLYTTIVRYDPVYHNHFKCNFGLVRHTYPHINRWLKNLYWNYPAFKETTDFGHIKEHYYWSHTQINPTRIVPVGPVPAIEDL